MWGTDVRRPWTYFAFIIVIIVALSLAEDWAVLKTDTIHVAVRHHILINLYNLYTVLKSI